MPAREAQFHGFRCKNGYDSHGNIVYRAICPILDGYNGDAELAPMGAKNADVSGYGTQVLTYYQVKAIDQEVADYLFINAFDIIISNIVEIEGNKKQWWSCVKGYYNTIFHPWWVEHHLQFEAYIDAYFAEHHFSR